MEEKYIFIRSYKQIAKGSILIVDQEGITQIYNSNYEPVQTDIKQFDESLGIYLLKLDRDLFMTAHDSAGYDNWIREKQSDKVFNESTRLYSNEDAGQRPLYPFLTKCPETLVMYLRDIGLSNTQIMTQMFGEGNTYFEYLKAANKERKEFLLNHV